MLTRILLLLIALLLLPAWGIDRCWPHRRLRGAKRLIFYIVPLVITLLMVFAAIGERYTPEADRQKALLISAGGALSVLACGQRLGAPMEKSQCGHSCYRRYVLHSRFLCCLLCPNGRL